jgi:hypothetical protein
MYNERNERRADFGLGDVFGIRKAGDVQGTNGNAFYARIEKPHAILDGFIIPTRTGFPARNTACPWRRSIARFSP